MSFILIALSIAVSIITFSVAVYIIAVERITSQLYKTYVLISIGMTVWSFCYAVMFYTGNYTVTVTAYKISSLGWTVSVALLILFFHILRENILGIKRNHVVIIVMSAVFLLFFINVFRGKLLAVQFIKTEWGWQEVIDSHSVWPYLYLAALLFAIIDTVRILIQIYRRSPYKKYRNMVKSALIPPLAAFCAGAVFNIILPVYGFSGPPPLGHIFVAVMSITVGYSIIKYKTLSMMPQFYTDHLLFEISDIIILTDMKGSIVKINQAVTEKSGYRSDELLGKDISELLSEKPAVTIPLPPDGKKTITETVLITADHEEIPGSFVISLLTDRFNDPIGYFIVFHDLTEMKELEEATVSLQKVNEQLEELIVTDDLTGIYNRKKIDEELLREFNRFKRYNSNFYVIFFDIDCFKKINDSYGHNIGDAVLKKIAEIISFQKRDTDIFARWGGDEFLLIYLGEDPDDVEEFAERLRKSIEDAVIPGGVGVTGSFGIARVHHGEEPDELLKRADLALYKAKSSGRNIVINGN